MRRANSSAVVITAALLFIVVSALRAVSNQPVDALPALYTIPIGLIAARFGVRAGTAAALVAFGLNLTWTLPHGSSYGIPALGARLGAFLVAGIGIGLVSRHGDRLADQRPQIRGHGQRAARRSDLMQALTRELSRAATIQDVAASCIRRGVPLLRGARGEVLLLDPAGRELRAVSGPGRDPPAGVPLTMSWPPADAVRTASPVYLRTAEEVARLYRDSVRTPGFWKVPGRGSAADAGSGSRFQAGVAVPLIGTTGVIGALWVVFTRPRRLARTDRRLFVTVAARVSEAIERARLLEIAGMARERAEASEQRAQLLAEVGAVLTSSLQSAERMQRLVDLLVPGFADMATILGVPEAVTAHHPELLAAAHADPGQLPRLIEVSGKLRLDQHDGNVLARTIRSGMPDLVPDVPGPATGDPAQNGAGVSALAELQPCSSIAVPLIARGTVLAGLLLAQSSSRRHFSDADLSLAMLIAGRAGLALDNAHLFEQQRMTVTTLQHSLLPGALPRIPGVTATARYRPGTEVLEVGGDWFDVLALPDDRVGIVLGDVVGRGVHAAATMGQLRSAVAAIAPYCEGPSQMLHRLDTFAGTVSGASLATVAYAEYTPVDGRLRYACAGHPPPVLINEYGGTELLLGGRGVPLGTGAGLPWIEAEVIIEQRTTLVCYSDGLIEQRGSDVDTRIEQLADTCRELSGRPLTQLADGLLSAMVGDGPLGDDVAVLCLVLHRVPAPVFEVELDSSPEQLIVLRDQLRAWATAGGLDRRRTADLVLAVHEASANAVEHAYLDVGRGLVSVRVELERGGSVLARVSDAGCWREQDGDDGHRGRGLPMIRAAMTDVDIDSTTEGTTVTMRLASAGR